MSFRPPQNTSSGLDRGAPPSAIDMEIIAEMAAALGRAGQKVEQALEQLNAASDTERAARLKAAAKAVHAYFIQRELCGLRRHDDAINHYGIPRAVLVRLGAD
ncbi:hypothetical protein GF108_17005 [Phyllobacterium sp. SYP-B3895]|uniref:Uncharacterized protein n=1 Tax=Phyllobacterium pellucidum TaxID=2740464 RepID=A0A849VNB8_9HYPH|nr:MULTISPECIES: DUF6665 family protein [Phyllobacterium]MRG57278.1 hypothetical protein [Phyllobacterium sp. SYP-B3895]NTS31321.1 hypothetical protein [Phyllobacterium pellucidum]UGY08847.1 hypothetical protein LLE51_012525 [Phyllobacterium sp. T1018]